MSHQSFDPKTLAAIRFSMAGMSIVPLSPAQQGAADQAIEGYRNLTSGLNYQVPAVGYGTGTPNWERSTVLPCTDTISIRLTPQRRSESLLLDFVSAADGTSIQTPPGLKAYELSGANRRELWVSRIPGSQVRLCHVHPKFEHEIRSAADDRLIMQLSFQSRYTPVLEPRVAN